MARENESEMAANAVRKSRSRRKKTDNIVTLSTGVKLKCNKVPEWMVADIYDEFNKNRPPIPVYLNERKGREEPNPNDPDYLDALEDWELEVAMALNNALIISGTEIESIPEDMHGPDDEKWLAKMRAMDRPVHNEYLAYLQWIKYYAGPDAREDSGSILEVVGRLSGIRESDVETAVQRFPDKDGEGSN